MQCACHQAWCLDYLTPPPYFPLSLAAAGARQLVAPALAAGLPALAAGLPALVAGLPALVAWMSVPELCAVHLVAAPAAVWIDPALFEPLFVGLWQLAVVASWH